MGKVYLVGGGPGAPKLLTVKAARLIASADVVLHDSLVGSQILLMIPTTAEVVDVGKRAGKKLLTQDEINSLLVANAKRHSVVVRLKGGDPSIFGRAAEEIFALREAGIDYEIVPGVTAGLSAAAVAGISLTDRRIASQVLFSTFSRREDGNAMDWGGVTASTTLVFYMPGPDYAEVSSRLRENGMPADLPCVIVSQIRTPTQQIRWTTVGRLATEEKLPAPTLLIVGRVALQQVSELTSNFVNRPSFVVARHAAQERKPRSISVI
jgi:uroporphyrin-III C-methyltransferase / precorrin-2 dehydrogenase / sirohydrochlorin ferrochelatase